MSSPNNNNTNTNNINTTNTNNEKGMVAGLIDKTKSILVDAKDIITNSGTEHGAENVGQQAGRNLDVGAAKTKAHADVTKEHAHDAGEKLEDKTKEKKQVTKDNASNLMDKASEKGKQADEKLGEWTDKASHEMHNFKNDLHQAGEKAEQDVKQTSSNTNTNSGTHSHFKSAEERIKDEPQTKQVDQNYRFTMDDNVHEPAEDADNRQRVPSTLEGMLSSSPRGTDAHDYKTTTDSTGKPYEESKFKMDELKHNIHAAGEKIEDKTKQGASQARKVIHDATKSKDQKEAEKPLGQKFNEATPDSAAEAGHEAGKKLDHGFDRLKATFEQHSHAQ